MTQTTLNIFQNFHCIAGDCKHSCCIGWEIDIDEDSLDDYRQVSGDFGRRLSANIEWTETPHFKLTKDERCPFLNRQNLCDIILNLGEESLCQICTDHPRFRNFFSDRTEIGLGLCCEAAAKQVLSFKEKAEEVVLVEEDGGEPLSAWEQTILSARQKLIAVAQDRSLPFSARLQKISDYAGAKAAQKSLSGWAAFYKTLERLSPDWDKELEILAQIKTPLQNPPEALPDTPFEQLSVYFLYRHLPNAEDARDLKKRAGFAALSCQILFALCLEKAATGEPFSVDTLAELARMYSSEIEYSQENMGSLLDVL